MDVFQMTYSWIIYSCLIFGTGILCDRKIEKRQAATSCSANTDDMFSCLNGLSIEWPLVCDGQKDCSDGSDETKELCAMYEFGTNMTMDCGKLNIKNQVISEGILSFADESFSEGSPWTVIVFRNTSKWVFISFGTIIAPNIVISKAEGFRSNGINSKQTSINDGEFKIGGFPYIRRMIDPVKKSINVTTIYMVEELNRSYKPKSPHYLSVLVLANKISFGNGYEPICIDWFSKYNVRNQALIKIIGEVKHKKNILKATKGFFPYIDNSTCLKLFDKSYYSDLVNYDKICIELTDQDAYYRLPGIDISFIHSNTYFLTGVNILEDHQVNYNFIKNTTLIGITDIKYHIPWIRGILNKHVTVNSCVLPTAEGVIYSYEDSNEILSHGTLVDRHTNVVEDCEVGYHKAFRYSNRYCRGRGKWLVNPEKLCFKMCQPLESDSLDIECKHDGKYANCSNLSIPSTTAKPFCKPSYTQPNGQTDGLPELVCQSNGIWDKQLYECKPTCGKVYDMSDVLIFNGKKANLGTAPWNVAVYKFNNKTFNYTLICGGSIISPNLVVSAAHCFWNLRMPKEIKVNDGRYKIAVGKYDRNFTINDNEFTKIINVEMVYVHERYYDSSLFYYGDIAIILLQNRVSFSKTVAPVCLDWNRKYNEINGDQGKIVGWGQTENSSSSDILLEASMPYLDFSSCRNVFTNGFESFVTADKFCAGSADLLVSEQTMGYGDSGASISFLHSSSYYLTGVTSVKDHLTNNSITVFTDIKYHIQWIRELRDKLSPI